MFFFAKQTAIIQNGIDAIFSNIADEYHGQVFIEFEEVIEFIDRFIVRLKAFRDESYSEHKPKIYFAPSSPNAKDWIDITIWVEGILTCKIIRAKGVQSMLIAKK